MRQLVIAGMLMVGVWGSGCQGLTGPSGEAEYRVTGTASRVDVTYENADGGMSQVSNVTVPWSYRWSSAESGDFLYVSAQIVNASGGSVTVTIRKDGDTFKSSTSSGFASIATASGSY